MACPQDALQDLLPCGNKPAEEPEVEEKMPSHGAEVKDVEQGPTPVVDVADAKADTGADAKADTGAEAVVKNDRLAALEARMMQQENEMALLKDRVSDLEFDEDVHYPQDCYSFIAVHGPGSQKWHPGIFAFGFLAYLFQMTFLLLLFIYFFKSDYFVGDGQMKTLDPIIVITQFVAVVFFALMPDASLQDIITAHQIWPRTQTADKVGRMISCVVRFTQGFVATLVALILILTSTSAVDIILNFTAVNFISDIDGTLFSLAKKNVFGGTLADAADHISNKHLPEQATAKKYRRYQAVMGVTFLLMVSITIMFTVKKEWKDDIYYFLSPEIRPTKDP